VEITNALASSPSESKLAEITEKAHLQLVPEMNQQELKTTEDKVIPPVEIAATVSTYKTPVEQQTEEDSFHFPARSSADMSSILMQKLAVAAAIISLLAVFGLLANAIFNPDAYNYGIDKKLNPGWLFLPSRYLQ